MFFLSRVSCFFLSYIVQENELNKVRKEKEKIGSDFKKYKKRAGQILETQKKKGEEVTFFYFVFPSKVRSVFA